MFYVFMRMAPKYSQFNLKISGKPVGHHKEDITNTIKALRHDMHKVLHFIDHLSKDVIQNKDPDIKGE